MSNIRRVKKSMYSVDFGSCTQLLLVSSFNFGFFLWIYFLLKLEIRLILLMGHQLCKFFFESWVSIEWNRSTKIIICLTSEWNRIFVFKPMCFWGSLLCRKLDKVNMIIICGFSWYYVISTVYYYYYYCILIGVLLMNISGWGMSLFTWS